MKKTKYKPELTKKNYEDLGKIVASVYETGYLDAAKSYRHSFIKGMFQGLGGAIGATLLLGLVIWILSFFGEVPFVGRLVDNIERTVQQ